jgi:hypothetical protein
MSLGVFGRYMMDGIIYVARIQNLTPSSTNSNNNNNNDNDFDPYLCTINNNIINAYHPSIYMQMNVSSNIPRSQQQQQQQRDTVSSSSLSTSTRNNENDNNGNGCSSSSNGRKSIKVQLPIVLLVPRGKCPFYINAKNVESIDTNIVFFNYI